MSRLGSWATREWSFPIWVCPGSVALPGWMGTGSLALSMSRKRTGHGVKRGLGPRSALRQGRKTASVFPSFSTHACSWATARSKLRQLAEQRMDHCQEAVTQLLFQWWCDRFGRAIPTPSILHSDWHLWANRCGQLEVTGGGDSLYLWVRSYCFLACETNSPLEGSIPRSCFSSCVPWVKLLNLSEPLSRPQNDGE